MVEHAPPVISVAAVASSLVQAPLVQTPLIDTPSTSIATPVVPVVDCSTLDWADLRTAAVACTACGLCAGRTQVVFGTGHTQAPLLVIGEAPGEQEDIQGEPFVGKAGQLLDAMLAAIGRTRTASDAAQSIYIANIVKCRPPHNRDPLPEEAAACRGYLARQIALIQPRAILCVGRVAAHNLLEIDTPITRLRGSIKTYGNIPVHITFHPSYLLRKPQDKALAWKDLLALKQGLL